MAYSKLDMERIRNGVCLECKARRTSRYLRCRDCRIRLAAREVARQPEERRRRARFRYYLRTKYRSYIGAKEKGLI